MYVLNLENEKRSSLYTYYNLSIPFDTNNIIRLFTGKLNQHERFLTTKSNYKTGRFTFYWA